LHPTHVKALVGGVKTFNEFQALGRGESHAVKASVSDGTLPPDGEILNDGEKQRLEEISKKKDELRKERAQLKNVAELITMAKAGHIAYAEREAINVKDICGWDSILSWQLAKIERWKATAEGAAAFENAALQLHPAPEAPASDAAQKAFWERCEELRHPRVVGPLDYTHTICLKKRCEGHRQWQRIFVDNQRLEEEMLTRRMQAQNKEETGILERARRRYIRETNARGH
jgi:COMPASS component SPP1